MDDDAAKVVVRIGATVVSVLIIIASAVRVWNNAQQELAESIAEGRATVEKHTFADGTKEVRIIWKEKP